MKLIDFSKSGGMPYTQDILNYLQGAWTDAFGGIMAQTTAPMTISGMQPGSVGGVSGILAGWLIYNGELLPFTASAIPPLTGGNVLVVKIAETVTGLNYFDGNTYTVLKVRSAYLDQGANVSNSTQFVFSSLQTLPYTLGINGRESGFSTIALSTTGTTGTLNYKKNFINNTLLIQGSASITVSSLGATPNPYFSMGTLPAGYRPTTNVPFSMYYRYHNSNIVDDSGAAFLRGINAEVQPGGTISAGLIKAASNYTVTFNTIIPLD